MTLVAEPPLRLVRAAALENAELHSALAASLMALTTRGHGEAVTDHRTSWVRRTRLAGQSVYIKTYVYPTLGDRLRGALRTTWCAPSRAAREWDALTWMRAAGFVAPAPLLVLEQRRFGWLRRASLVTEAYPGAALDRLLPEVAPAVRSVVLDAVVRLVARLHGAGFRDRNLDLRNLLAQELADGSWEIVKIDSPRFRLVRAGTALDRWADADWRRLDNSLRALALGLTLPRPVRSR